MEILEQRITPSTIEFGISENCSTFVAEGGYTMTLSNRILTVFAAGATKFHMRVESEALIVKCAENIQNPVWGEFEGVPLDFFDDVVFEGSSGDDSLVVANSNNKHVWFNGYAGNDDVSARLTYRFIGTGGDDADFFEVGCGAISGGDGNDYIISRSPDVISGTSYLYGDGGNDIISINYGTACGGGGNDFLYLGGGEIPLSQAANPDNIHPVTLNGGDDNDTLLGSGGDDKLYGDDGNDSLFGGNGSDILDGGSGNDSLYNNNGNDTLYGGEGDDSINTWHGTNFIVGGSGNDVITCTHHTFNNIIYTNDEFGQFLEADTVLSSGSGDFLFSDEFDLILPYTEQL